MKTLSNISGLILGVLLVAILALIGELDPRSGWNYDDVMAFLPVVIIVSFGFTFLYIAVIRKWR